MGPEVNSKSSTDASVHFSHVTTVATGWTLDFMFVCLCRHFKDGKLEEFNETLSTLQAVSQSPSLTGDVHYEKIMISALLARVMHGKQLDVVFEEDDCVMPLMSAAKIWLNLEESVADKMLFKNITILLLVQSVAVCLEKGQRASASSALKWFKNNQQFPQNLGAKLSAIVAQNETCHPFLLSFNFSCLLESIQSFLDAYLEKNPSDYLLKAAAKMVQSSQNTEGLGDVLTHDDKTKDRKTRRRLLSTKITDVWKPDTCKKPFVSLRRMSKSEICQLVSEKSADTSRIPKKRKLHKKWTSQLDKYLKDGVRQHGQGKWARILMDYDFEGRSGTMLKDRWRVLMRADKVG